MKPSAALLSDIGKKRQQNQDNASSRPDLGLFVVADGMGGHRGGETASRIAAEVIPEQVQNLLKKKPNHKAVLTSSIQKANEEIFDAGLKHPELQGMGTTTTALLFVPEQNKILLGHVGDSRCYFLRPGLLWQLTRDHSLVQEKLKAGIITRDQLKTDRMKNVLTRSVGFEPKVQVELYEMDVHEGDTFLLCSDGLSGLVSDADILKTVEDELFANSNINAALEKLIATANKNGGDDNITALIVHFS